MNAVMDRRLPGAGLLAAALFLFGGCSGEATRPDVPEDFFLLGRWQSRNEQGLTTEYRFGPLDSELQGSYVLVEERVGAEPDVREMRYRLTECSASNRSAVYLPRIPALGESGEGGPHQVVKVGTWNDLGTATLTLEALGEDVSLVIEKIGDADSE
jgi:hypothetical protein